ncbi:MAG: HIT domain-containing protein [Bacteriovoracaceae bacterium]|nr:HIT domain-containing protein [Bacteriovoracaceae bacterium]
MSFIVDPVLKKDTHLLGELDLCEVRLLPDSSNPWLILIPKCSDIKEIFQLTAQEQGTLMAEIVKVSEMMSSLFSPDKINIGALGNMVPQLHIHIICRFKEDRAWPGSIWGTPCGEEQGAIDDYIDQISKKLW